MFGYDGALMATQPLAWQASLLGAGSPSAAVDFGGARRRELSGGAWVEHVPSCLAGADQLFADLLHRLDWQAREMPMYGQLVPQPRLSAFWSLADEAVRYPLLAELALVLGRRYGVRFKSVGANLYRDGRDSVAFHGDRHARSHGDPDVAIPCSRSVRPAASCSSPVLAVPRLHTRPGPATCWSWAAPASAPGSIPSPRSPPPAPASASPTGPLHLDDGRRPAELGNATHASSIDAVSTLARITAVPSS